MALTPEVDQPTPQVDQPAETTNGDSEADSQQHQTKESGIVVIPPQPVPAEVREYLFGEPNDTMVCVGQCVFPTLLYTGSTVSTISLAGLEFMEQAILHQIKGILHIECADGLNLPYLGYTQTAVKIPGIEEVEQEVVLLVVHQVQQGSATPAGY